MLNRNKHQRARRDSGGLVIYIRNEFCDGNTLVKVNEDCIIWVKLNGELFHIDSDLYVCLCYNTPVGSSRANYSDRSVFDMILDDILYFEAHLNGNCHFIVSGNPNARTANLPDYVACDSLQLSDLLPEDYDIDSSLPRVSEDKVSNEYGNQLLEFCKATGLKLANGRLGEDTGQFTCIKGNGSSVVDYVLCKPDLFNIICSFEIGEPNLLSDHCAINFSLNMFLDLNVIGDHNKAGDIEFKYVWYDEKKS